MNTITETIVKSRGVEGMTKPLLMAALSAVGKSCQHNPFCTEVQPTLTEDRCFLLRYEAICDSSSKDIIDSDALAKIWADHRIEALAYCEKINAIGGRASAIKAVSNLVVRLNNQDKPYYTYKQIEDALYNDKGALKDDIQQLLAAAVIDRVAQAYKNAQQSKTA